MGARSTGAASAAGAADRSDSSRPQRQNQAAADKRPEDGVVELPMANVNAVRAAIKAGVKPTVAARQFGVSLAAIRLVLGKGQ